MKRTIETKDGPNSDRRLIRTVLPLLILTLLSLLILTFSCTIKYVYVKEGYEKNEMFNLKRVALLVEPLTNSNKKVRLLIMAILRDYISVHKDYILLPTPNIDEEKSDIGDYCKADPRLNGILMNRVRKLNKVKGEVLLGIQAVLYDCEKNRVWESYGEDTLTAADPDLATLGESYANRIGPGVRDLAAPCYLLIREIYESLPIPKLSEEEKLEKIDNMQ